MADGWSNEELAASVDAYREMLRMQTEKASTTHLTFAKAIRNVPMSTEPKASRIACGTWAEVVNGWAVETDTCSRIKAVTT